MNAGITVGAINEEFHAINVCYLTLVWAICSEPCSETLNRAESLLVTNDELIPKGWRATTTHNGCESNLVVDLGHPLLVTLGSALASEDDVHLLETQTLGLWHEEPDESCSKKCYEAKEDVSSVGDMLEEIRGDLTNNEVVHPVA